MPTGRRHVYKRAETKTPARLPLSEHMNQKIDQFPFAFCTIAVLQGACAIEPDSAVVVAPFVFVVSTAQLRAHFFDAMSCQILIEDLSTLRIKGQR